MKAPSRTLPPKAAPQNGPSMLSGIVLTLFIGAAGWSAVVSLPFRWVAGTSLVVCVLIAAYDRARLKRLRHERRADSICTFARALPARHHDTWVVRAVYEELSDSARAPLRPSDDLEKFWGSSMRTSTMPSSGSRSAQVDRSRMLRATLIEAKSPRWRE